ncbi:unnamed protein product [Hymenolepis diminuta]|uniref:Uncharacterized protein n=1 Tax=Hymenolepis diminuta TaxID=6216 RepID=A0A564Z7X4_HYMDI|nr:unnamed protein product [Hymenolepis diminuta]
MNIVCSQVAHPHRSEGLSVPLMIVAETLLTRLYWESVLSTLFLSFPTTVPSN